MRYTNAHNLMVRISDLMKNGQQPGTAAPAPASPAPSATPQPPLPPLEPVIVYPQALEPAPTPSGAAATVEEASALHAELVAACHAVLTSAEQERKVAVGAIPSLAGRLVDRVVAGETELLRLSIDQESGFSLAMHSANVAILAVTVALELGWKRPQLLDLAVGGLLHDIGMVRVSHLIGIPTHLGSDQVAQIRAHPIWGHQMLQASPDLPAIVSDVALQEHERYDGSGYPHRLSGGEINPNAQVVGLLDLYEALTHDRPHRRRLVAAEAMRAMIEDYRPWFQLDLFRAFLAAVPIYPVGSWVRLNTGQSASVIAARRQSPLTPSVEIRVDARGYPLASPERVDLAEDRRYTIVRAIPAPAPVTS